jgi:two-component sensor histidine kinase
VRIVRWSDKMPRWVRVTGSMTNDIETYLFCIVEDIHEEKMIAERQKLLLNELNHRVKNTLATVQSLAMNTMKLSDPTAFYLDFEARLLALSHAHNLLTREEWIGVSFKELVELPLTTFAGKRYHAEGPEIELKPNAAVTLSMVFHELATNAAKYGSLSESEGKVILEWIVNKESGNKFLDIFWREIDGPEVSLPTRRGFGSRLIEVAAPREFSGGAKITYPKTGVQCHFRIPLSGIVISE